MFEFVVGEAGMQSYLKRYIDGAWVESEGGTRHEVIDPATERPCTEITTLEAGRPDLPEGVAGGYHVRPTLFSNVSNDMTIAREEIFGPVVTIIPYEDDDDAVRIANDTVYGLSAAVSGDPAKARAIVPRLRAGMVYVNTGTPDPDVAFGGYKQSGNGREYGKFGLAEFMEVKSVIGELA